MRHKPICARLANSCDLLSEIDKAKDVCEWVVVCALRRCRVPQDVAEHGGVADFLLGHEFDEIAVVAAQARGFKVAGVELRQAETEEVEFDPFLV
jgi:hypothetical protein